MNAQDRRRQLLGLAEKIESNCPLENDEAAYLSKALREIAHGAEPGEALGTKFGKGQSRRDAEARKKTSVILHMVSALVNDEEAPLSIKDACEKVMPFARTLFGDDAEGYDAEYLQKRWHELKHMQALDRIFGDPDFPYAPV